MVFTHTYTSKDLGAQGQWGGNNIIFKRSQVTLSGVQVHYVRHTADGIDY
jgi:hypothetical protein